MVRNDQGGSGAGLSIFALIIGLLMMAGAAGAYFLGPRFLSGGGEELPPATLTTPEKIGGLSLSQEPQLVEQSNAMKAAIAADAPDATSTMGAVYTDELSASKFVIVAAAAVPIDDTGGERTAIFAAQKDASIQPEADVDVDAAASKGGSAGCAKGTASEVPLVVCVWTDPGSVGIIYFFDRTIEDSSTMFPQVKTAILAA